jgi:opacity protein-like surface antigen
MKKITLTLAAVSLIFTASTSAHKSFYIGAGSGPAHLKFVDEISYYDQGTLKFKGEGGSTLTGRLNAGYHFNTGWSVELGHNFFAHVKTNADTCTSTKTFDILGIYGLPISKTKFAVDLGYGISYKKILHYYWLSFSNQHERTDSVVSTLMLGVRYAITSNIDINGQFRYWSSDISEIPERPDGISAALLGLSYNF